MQPRRQKRSAVSINREKNHFFCVAIAATLDLAIALAPCFAQLGTPKVQKLDESALANALTVTRTSPLLAENYKNRSGASVTNLDDNSGGEPAGTDDYLPLSGKENLLKGKRLLLADKPDQALPLFAKFVAANPESAQGFFFLGTALSENDKFELAITALTKAITLANNHGFDSAQFHVNLGNCFLQQREVDDAIGEFRAAEQIMPSEPRAHLNMARAFLEKGNPVYAEMALRELRQAESAHLEPPLIPLLKARSLELLGKPAEAAQVLRSYEEVYLKDRTTSAERQKVECIIANLKPHKTTNVGPTVPEARHYEIKPSDMYVIFDLDEHKNLVTLAISDNKDPDGGAQDGEDDGFITMPVQEFMSQVRSVAHKDGTIKEAHK